MPTILHSNLGGSELHEPKGVGAAPSNQFYVSDGAGSGTWMYVPTGWGYYQDGTGVAQTFNTTPAKISIDGTGTLTETDYLPPEIRGSSELWDTSGDIITPIRLGDSYDFRIDLPVTSESGSPTEATLTLDISGAGTPATPIITRFLVTGKSTPYTLTVGFPILVLTSLVITNGIQLFLQTDTGSIDVTDPSVVLVRNHGGEF